MTTQTGTAKAAFSQACDGCLGVGWNPCMDCDSTGTERCECNCGHRHDIDCYSCEGTKRLECWDCDGTGRVPLDDDEEDDDI